eukprot:scaffold101290_cov63-Phaeocystis_antarctica.AAC.3
MLLTQGVVASGHVRTMRRAATPARSRCANNPACMRLIIHPLFAPRTWRERAVEMMRSLTSISTARSRQVRGDPEPWHTTCHLCALPLGLTSWNKITAGNAPSPSPSTSRCTPSGTAAPERSTRTSVSSAGSTQPSVPSNARSVAERPLPRQPTFFASRSSLQFRNPTLRHSAAAA